MGKSIDVLTVANTLVKEYSSNSKIEVSGNYRLGDIRGNYSDLTKIKEKLGFEPKDSFEEGVSKSVKWVNLQEVFEDKYESSIDEMKEKGLYK